MLSSLEGKKAKNQKAKSHAFKHIWILVVFIGFILILDSSILRKVTTLTEIETLTFPDQPTSEILYVPDMENAVNLRKNIKWNFTIPDSFNPCSARDSRAVTNFCRSLKGGPHNVLRSDVCHRNSKKVEHQVLSQEPPCRTLWFAAMSLGTESKCKESFGGYKEAYTVALQSASYHAPDTLQPVLMLYRQSPNEPVDKIVTWAHEKHGAIVIAIDKLSFDDVIKSLLLEGSGAHNLNNIGPFMRIDIPKIIKNHQLMDMPGICDRHILYTDCDVIFANPITWQDLSQQKARISPPSLAHLMYGPEAFPNEGATNTGVMLIDVHRFHDEMTNLINHAVINHDGPFIAYDQGWINDFYSSKIHRGKRVDMPFYWNWKSYWKLEPDSLEDIKVFHFHGPKPGKFIDVIANCDFEKVIPGNVTDGTLLAYQWLIFPGICCDGGRTGSHFWEMYKRMRPSVAEYC